MSAAGSLLRFEKAVHRDTENEHILIAVARDLAGPPRIHAAVFEQRGHLLLSRAGLVPSRVTGVEIPVTGVIRLALRTAVADSRRHVDGVFKPHVAPPAIAGRLRHIVCNSQVRTRPGRTSGRASTGPFRSPMPWWRTRRRSARDRTTATDRRRSGIPSGRRCLDSRVPDSTMSLARIGPSKSASLAPPTFAASSSQPAIGTASARSASYPRFRELSWSVATGAKVAGTRPAATKSSLM